MYKIAVVGDRDSVLGFQALGLSVFVADTPDQAKETLARLAKGDYAIIYLTEQAGRAIGGSAEAVPSPADAGHPFDPGEERFSGHRHGEDYLRRGAGRGGGHPGKPLSGSLRRARKNRAFDGPFRERREAYLCETAKW